MRLWPLRRAGGRANRIVTPCNTGVNSLAALLNGLARTRAQKYDPQSCLPLIQLAMSRFRRVVHNVTSSYLSLVVAAVYSLASVPLALHYLSKDRFALWALLSAIGNYLSLVDLGMSGAVARLLIDHKDEPGSGNYGSLIKTGWLVLVIQGVLVFAVGFGLAPVFSHLLKMPVELEPEFITLLRWQSGTWALSFGLRIFNHLLLAHQRMDIINHSQSAIFPISFALLWGFFHAGQGVFSLVWTNLVSVFLTGAITLAACRRMGLFPSAGGWGRASWGHFREMFNYGKDLFLVSVGSQLIMTSQIFIIKREISLEAAALWTVGTRVYSLLSQLIWRLFDMSGPAFSEMLVRGERALLLERYRSMVTLTASFSAFAAVGYAACNSQFVEVWTGDKFTWPVLNDVLLAVWMLVLAILHCHSGFVVLTKKLGFMRYIYFVEGIVFVATALLAAKWGGFPAMIGCSIVCSILFSWAYGIWRISNFFCLPVIEVAVRWLAPTGRFTLLFLPVALAAYLGTALVHQRVARFALNVLLTGGIGSYLFLKYGLSQTFQKELIRRTPKIFSLLLRKIFVTQLS